MTCFIFHFPCLQEPAEPSVSPEDLEIVNQSAKLLHKAFINLKMDMERWMKDTKESVTEVDKLSVILPHPFFFTFTWVQNILGLWLSSNLRDYVPNIGYLVFMMFTILLLYKQKKILDDI